MFYGGGTVSTKKLNYCSPIFININKLSWKFREKNRVMLPSEHNWVNSAQLPFVSYATWDVTSSNGLLLAVIY